MFFLTTSVSSRNVSEILCHVIDKTLCSFYEKIVCIQRNKLLYLRKISQIPLFLTVMPINIFVNKDINNIFKNLFLTNTITFSQNSNHRFIHMQFYLEMSSFCKVCNQYLHCYIELKKMKSCSKSLKDNFNNITSLKTSVSGKIK